MKFVNITENKITKVMLDLETLALPSYKLDSEDTVCVFDEVRNYDFTIVNEFLGSLDEPTLRYVVRTLTNMRRTIANSQHDDPAADTCVGELRRFMKDLFDDLPLNLPLSLTGNLFRALYNFSGKYVTPDKTDSRSQDINDKTWYAKDRQMPVAASLLSALCIMIIHDFKTHFIDVLEPLQVLYPVFEETIRDCGVDGAKDFVERNRNLVSCMEEYTASWVLEGIYINDGMLHKHGLLPTDIYVVECTTQRILSSKMYISSKRIREMKDFYEAEAQQRMDDTEMSVTPLTNEEIDEFNKEVDHGLLLPYRQQLKQALLVIRLTCWNSYIVQQKLISIDNLLVGIDEVINNVDKMSDAELRKILTSDSCASAAYNLTKHFLPQVMILADHNSQTAPTMPISNYIRKIFDICTIINTPTNVYRCVDHGFSTALRLKEVLAEFPGGKMVGNMIFPESYLYNQAIPAPVLPPAPLSAADMYVPKMGLVWSDALDNADTQIAIRNWMGDNLDDDHDAFKSFFLKEHRDLPHGYVLIKYPGAQSLNESQVAEMCTFFYRWFIRDKMNKACRDQLIATRATKDKEFFDRRKELIKSKE